MQHRVAMLCARLAAICLLLLGACGSTRTFVAAPEEDRPEGVPIDVEFHGVEQVAEFRLIRAIEDRMYDLSRQPDSEVVVQDAAFDIEDFYRQEGFPDVEVEARVERPAVTDADDPEDEVDPRTRVAIFEITEGPQVTVSAMDVVGADSYSRERLSELWLRRGSGALGLGDPLFVENDVLGFVEGLRLFLRGEGYLDAKVRLEEIVRPPGSTEVAIRIVIDEGVRYVVGNVDVAPDVAEAVRGGDFDDPTGAPAAAERIDAFRTAVREVLRRRGRPEPDVRVELSRRATEAGKFVDIAVVGRPGRVARIVEIRLEGLESTRESVVRDLLEVEEGQLYDGTALDESLRQLYLTGLFKRIDLETAWIESEGDDPSGIGRLRVVLRIVEQESETIEALIGYGSYERLRGKLRYEEANLFGTGRGLVLEGRLSQKGWRGLATVTDRDFLHSGLGLSISGDVRRREAPSFVDRAYGGTIAFTRELTERWMVRGGYSYRLHDGLVSEVQTPAADITRYTEGAPFLETRLDSRDSLIYPRDGGQLQFQIDANDPAFGADIEFVRARFGSSYYVPISERVSLALRADTGLLWPGERSDLVPLQERFYNGGENTVRSFRESLLGPLDVNGRPLGGEFRTVFGTELRARLIRTFEGALFADAGNLGADVDDYGLDDMRFAIGAGLRIALPIGPIRADVAWNPDRDPGEKEWVFHLTVGYPF